ncbi:type IV pilin biogenesis protein [Candidatus Williamhamiltonella defendens]|nr:protein transport protein HofC [Candidatus Hamiltonella defensa]AYB48781.1 type IV pilin biogenesis protein [Candidatus Hamiltonella defensa]
MKDHRLYKWKAINKNGSLEEGISLETQTHLVYENIIQSGLQPVSVKLYRSMTQSYRQKEYLINFTRQLATLLQAGLPLVNSLQLLAKDMNIPIWRCILQNISQEVSRGEPFSDAIRHYPKIFSKLYCELVAIGELTGHLDHSFFLLAQQQEQQKQLQKKVAKALRYPFLVCIVTLFVSLIMLILVLPEFAKIYASFDATLPWFTRALLFLSNKLINYGLYIASILILLGIVYCQILRKKMNWQQREQAFLFRLPFFSKLIRGHCLTQIFRTLAITQLAGLSLASGLKVSELSSNNLFYQKAVNKIYEKIKQGLTFSDALSQQNELSSYRLFPVLCQQFIRVGEESGSLDILLEKLATWYQKHTQELAENFTQMIEPILMLVVGVIVGILIIAMYLPIFQLSHVIK